MKPITMAATTTATAPAPEMRPNPARNGTMIRTIKADFDQSGDLSTLVSRPIVQQRWTYNMAVEKTLKDPAITSFDLYNKLTKWRSGNRWLDGPVLVQRAGLVHGREAALKFLESNATKRNNRIMWKNLSRKDREKEGLQDIDTTASLPPNRWSNKRNRWSHESDLFRKKGERQALCVFGKPVPKGGGLLHLPGIGTVKAHVDVEGLDMRSFQLVETTKRITGRTKDHNRTYRLHVQARMEAPRPSESAVVRGVDMGIVHNATTVDLGTGYAEFHDIQDGCRRTKGDGISKMYAELSRKRGGSGNRRIRQNGKGGGHGGSKSTNSNDRNKPRKPKSRSYKDLQRKIQRKREKVANRQTNWERHASKRMADGAGTVAVEDLNVGGMTARAKGRGSSAKRGLNREMAYSRPRMFLSRIGQSCANAGVKVISVYPGDTSTTCHMCGRRDKGSRVSQAEFICTNDKCECHINADINAAHNVAMRATGRRGSSSQGARFQAGIAPIRSASKHESQVPEGSLERQKKAEVPFTFVYNSLIPRPKPLSGAPAIPPAPVSCALPVEQTGAVPTCSVSSRRPTAHKL